MWDGLEPDGCQSDRAPDLLVISPLTAICALVATDMTTASIASADP